jgi:hypothetical protein
MMCFFLWELHKHHYTKILWYFINALPKRFFWLEQVLLVLLLLNAFNEVRLEGLPQNNTYQKRLFNERKVEFAWEGQYFFDLKRRGLTRSDNNYVAAGTGFFILMMKRTVLVSRKSLRPITLWYLCLQSAIDTNPSLLEPQFTFN